MTKTQQKLYELALSKIAIPNCECPLDEPDGILTSTNYNDTKTKNDIIEITRTKSILAQISNKIS